MCQRRNNNGEDWINALLIKHNSPTVNHHMVQWWSDSLQVNSSLVIALLVHSKNGLTKSDSTLLFCFVSCFNIRKLTKRFNILNASHSRAMSSMYRNFVNGFFQSLKHMFNGTFYCYHFVLLLLIQFFDVTDIFSAPILRFRRMSESLWSISVRFQLFQQQLIFSDLS